MHIIALYAIVAITRSDSVRADSLKACEADSLYPSRGAPTVDLNNPKYFVQIYERSATDTAKRVISQPMDAIETASFATTSGVRQCSRSTRRVQEYVYAEVDLDSKIIITFDLPWIVAHGADIDAEVGIEGAVGSRAIQIPGYSVIGQKIQTASIRIQSSAEALGTMGDIMIGRSALNSFSQYFRRRAIADNFSDTVAAEKLKSDLPRYLADSATNSYSDSELVQRARRFVLEDNNHILGALGTIDDTGSTMFRSALGRLFNRDPRIMAKDSALAKIQIDSLAKLPAAATYAQLSDVLSNLYFILNSYNPCPLLVAPNKLNDCDLRDSATKAKLTRLLSNLFVGSLKEADLLLSETGANDGDDILITIWNSQSTQLKQRAQTIRLHARRFGLLRRVTDSFLFINRVGASQASANAAVSAASKRAGTSGDTATANTADPVQFLPTAGVTLGWTYYRRTGAILRFLEPGAGVNVSFPQFKSTITAFTPSGGAATPPTVTVQQQGSIDVAVGPVFTLFDNAVQATLGWDLTAPKKQFYWGLGFSFISLVQKAANAASGPKASQQTQTTTPVTQ